MLEEGHSIISSTQTSLRRSTPTLLLVAEPDNKSSNDYATTPQKISQVGNTKSCDKTSGEKYCNVKSNGANAKKFNKTQQYKAASAEKKISVKNSFLDKTNANFNLQIRATLPQGDTSRPKEVVNCNKIIQSHNTKICKHTPEQNIPVPLQKRINYYNVTQNGKFSTNSNETKKLLSVPKEQELHTCYSQLILQVPLNGAEITAYSSDPSNGSRLKYEQLEDRLKAFILPPPWRGAVDARQMSGAGFVYTGQEDLVYCFSCKIKLDGWTKHMDPLLRHKEESPTCSFVRQQLQVIKGEKGKVKSVVAPSKPLNPRQTASIGQLQSSTLFSSKPIHTVVTGLDEPQLFNAVHRSSGSSDDYFRPYLPITKENYSMEEERLKSFIGWPLNESVHPEQLARVGFVYTGEGSLVQCFQCGVRYRNWLKGDIPLSIHQRCNPRCAFLHTLTNKSKSSEEQSSDIPELLPNNIQNNNITLEFPKYDDQATRLQSFKYWGGVLPKEELAEAGFYMIARRDIVRCFSCHVVLQDWEKTDNVIDEHRRHSPECNFLKVFFSHNVNIMSQQPRLGNTTSVTERSFDASVGSHNGLDNIQIYSSNKSPYEIENSNYKPQSPDSPGEPSGIIYPPSWPSHNILSNPDENIASSESHEQKKDDYAWLTSLHTTTSNSRHIMFEESSSQEVENNINVKISKSKTDDDMSTTTNTGLCQICYDKKIECIFLPCGHARTCEECATRIKNSGKPCPYCRMSVSTTHRIYL